MIILNDQKFACESCIKGHRSSSCQHTDRPLFEIKKKGRPVSQCERCRELRKTKRMHNKCTCTTIAPEQPTRQPQASGSTTAKRPRRFKPIAPALPNGIKDLTTKPAQSLPITITISDVSPLSTATKPCGCGSPSCRCGEAVLQYSGTLTQSRTGQRPESGLAALAAAAALCSSHHSPHVIHETPSPCPTSARSGHHRDAAQLQQHCATSAGSQSPKYLFGRPSPDRRSSRHKRRRSNSEDGSQVTSPFSSLDDRRLQLPPLRYSSTSEIPSHASGVVPAFPPIPSLREIASLAGSGCCCGVECACPGCVEHRGPVHAAKELPDCPDGCGTCVDNEGGVSLPSPRSSSNATTSSHAQPNFIDAFFARAAALPPPPARRTTALDATNVTVYPTTLFSGDAKDREARGAAFGLVSVPLLQCGCLGGCGCPAGRCGCGEGCGGCC